MIILMLHNFTITRLISFYFACLKILTLQFNRGNIVHFKAMAHCVCCRWKSLEWVWGSKCAAGGFVVCVCVCVGIVLLLVKKIE